MSATPVAKLTSSVSTAADSGTLSGPPRVLTRSPRAADVAGHGLSVPQRDVLGRATQLVGGDLAEAGAADRAAVPTAWAPMTVPRDDQEPRSNGVSSVSILPTAIRAGRRPAPGGDLGDHGLLAGPGVGPAEPDPDPPVRADVVPASARLACS